IVSYGTIEVPPNTISPENLLIIRNELKMILEEHIPEFASVEELFFSKNQKTAKNVFESRGVILLTLIEAKIKIIQPTVSQIKKGITGNGNADKKQVKKAIQLLFGIKNLTGHDDSWDAIAAAFVGFSMIGSGRIDF
ncbi:MAG: crossover junction endodeoxyribonuclease RuvC, partial [Leptospiraceae bacterium]|nr:crossover junction endodeoxyribonuclease RuvC [Leptospiraceae bacterium]